VRGVVEAVPNLSEGRRLDVVDRLAAAADRTTGAGLLHRTSDPDHGRTVLTVAGNGEAVRSSMEEVVATAIASIDMREHIGVHPRIGAVDVVPFVPLEGASLAECAELARAFGGAIAARHELPVYLYAEAAATPARRILADVRRSGFEGLAAWMSTPEGKPDLGPPRPHPTAGATVVGARPVLIAWNIQLETGDVAVARRIAAEIRERGGGFPRVQALGLHLASEGRAQVSMNVLDHAISPLWRIWERVSELASRERVTVVDSELIGLVPRGALESVADHVGIRASDEDGRATAAGEWLRIRDFTPDRVIETRLRLLVPPA
jgi:glutamate formiminotransferase / 5-formyltetrahydrofolate cyclo-ligase